MRTIEELETDMNVALAAMKAAEEAIIRSLKDIVEQRRALTQALKPGSTAKDDGAD